MKKGSQKVSKERILEAIKGSYGIKTNIASRLRVSRNSLDKYLSKSKELKDAYESEKTSADDFVESKLMELIEEGNTAATIFYAKTKMRDRGYAERVGIETEKGGLPIIVNDVRGMHSKSTSQEDQKNG